MSPRIRSAQRERAMIEAALQVFLEKGFDGATMLEIATRAQVGKGTLYGLAKSKEDLCLLVLMDFFQQLVSEITPGDMDNGDPMELLRGIIHQAGASFQQNSATLALSIELLARLNIRTGMSDKFKRAFSELYAQFFEPVETLLQAAIDKGQIRQCNTHATARLIGAVLDGLGFQFLFDKEKVDMQQVVVEFTDQLEKALAIDAGQ